MKVAGNPCGTAKAKIYAKQQCNGIPVYFGSGVNPANSPAQFFVAWGKEVLLNGLIPTYNDETPDRGFIWFIEEEEAEAKFEAMRKLLAEG